MTHSHTCPHTHGHRFAGTHTGTGRRTHQMRPQHSQSKSAPTALPTLNVRAALSGSLCPSLSFHPVPLSRFSLPLFPCVCLLPLTLIFALSVSLSLFSSLCLSFALTVFCGLSDFHSCSLSISHFFPLSIFLLLSSTLSDFLTSPTLPLPLLSADFCARPKATDSAQSQSCDTKAVEGRGTLMSVDGAEDLSEVPLTGDLSLFETSSRV